MNLIHQARKVSIRDRAPGVMDRHEYVRRAHEIVPRGQELPQSKLLDMDVMTIRSAARQRENLRQHIKANLSNDALAKSFGVHVRTIEKVLSYESWRHIA